ncbi:unnamed protein product [Brassica oleracea]
MILDVGFQNRAKRGLMTRQPLKKREHPLYSQAAMPKSGFAFRGGQSEQYKAQNLEGYDDDAHSSHAKSSKSKPGKPFSLAESLTSRVYCS